MAGRPTKLTPEIQERIVALLRAGNYVETAAAYCDVGKVSLYAWMKRGHRQPKSIYGAFLNAIEKAQAESEIRDLEQVRKAEPWESSAWRLERKHPTRWGRRDRLDVMTEPTTLKIVIDDGGSNPSPA